MVAIFLMKEEKLIEKTFDYTEFSEIKICVFTWNIDSRKPSDMESGDGLDTIIFDDFIRANQSADLFIFGFQELVDLESKSQTASNSDDKYRIITKGNLAKN